MKLTITRPVEIEAVTMRIIAPVRYENEDMPFDFPHRKNDNLWDIVVDLDTGIIRNWPKLAAEVFMKVVDGGSYYLFDACGNQLAAIEEDYVPDCIPQQYGDYINFNIKENGKIEGWEKCCTPNSVREEFFKKEEK
jgi:hypothetical protein